MKKIIPIVVIGVLLVSGLGAVAFPEIEYFEKTEIISFSEPIINELGEHTIINI